MIHMMRYGHTACLLNGPPRDWPEGHYWADEWKDVTCVTCLAGKDLAVTFSVAEDGKSIKCLRCHRTSYHPMDVERHYCSACGVSHDDIWPPARRAWLESGPVYKQLSVIQAALEKALKPFMFAEVHLDLVERLTLAVTEIVASHDASEVAAAINFKPSLDSADTFVPANFYTALIYVMTRLGLHPYPLPSQTQNDTFVCDYGEFSWDKEAGQIVVRPQRALDRIVIDFTVRKS